MRLPSHVSIADTDDGVVLLQQRTGRYFQLNHTGGRVMRRLLDGGTPEAVAAELVADYGIETERAEHDVNAVIEQLRTAEVAVD